MRLESFVSGTSLAHVVSLYEFDHELRTPLGDALSTIETAFRQPSDRASRLMAPTLWSLLSRRVRWPRVGWANGSGI